MKYIWTEDTGAGLHYWDLANEYLFHNSFIVESKGSNQGLLDAVRQLLPKEEDRYYLAFDVVYDNMDVMNKYLELSELAAAYQKQVVVLDMLCFEHIILSFTKLIEWTGTGKKDKIVMREILLSAIQNHKIEIDKIGDRKTKAYLMGFRRYSTERVIKAITHELTENDEWSVKGRRMGDCWHQNCCISQDTNGVKCGMGAWMSGDSKLMELLKDAETQKVLAPCICNQSTEFRRCSDVAYMQIF